MDASWVIQNELLRIALSEETQGGLSQLVDLKSGRNFIASHPEPLYRLTLRGEKLTTISSIDSTSLYVERRSSQHGETLILTYGPHTSPNGEIDIRVTCRLLLESGSGLSKWRIAIENNTGLPVRDFQFPVVLAPSPLGDSDEDDCFLSANEFRGFVRGSNIRTSKIGGQYPGSWTVQMQAYYDDEAGLYMATYDDSGCVKKFGTSDAEGALDLSITHCFNETPGLNLDIPYDTVLGVFHGDWYAAADIYKQWAHKQHWCAKMIDERDDVPSWLKEPRPWLAIISRGNYERLRGTLWSPHAEHPIGKFWPARKVVPIMREYSRLFGTPVVTWMEGWEQIGSPGGPVDIFPPLEGEKSFKTAMARLNRDGNLPFMYLAGFHWCYRRPSVGYDAWDRFEREGRELAQILEDGSLNMDVYPDNQKYYVQLCIANRDTQQLYMDNFLKLADLGGVALQLDQQHAWAPVACYSDRHGHPHGYGPWMYQENLKFLRQVRQAIKSRNSDATISVETPCEIWLQEMDVFMHRPNGPNCLPLFDYIYHEYALFYGGDELSPYQHPDVALMTHAALCVYGVQQFVGIGDEEFNYQVDPNYPALKLVRNICQAQRTFARDYLVFGRMLRPTELEVDTVNAYIYKTPETAAVPLVMHAVWRSQHGTIGYVLANWSGTAQKVRLELVDSGGELFFVTPKGRRRIRPSEDRTGSISVSVPARGIVLVEQEYPRCRSAQGENASALDPR